MADEQRKPNILLIMADEHATWASGFHGHPFVRTPNLDALARRGSTFDAAYCGSPICVPSRAALATGLRVEHNGVWDNGVPMRSDLPTWPHYLTTRGYQTVLAGKHHFMGPDQLHGFELRLGGEVHSTRIIPGGAYQRDSTFDLKAWFRSGPGHMRYDDFDEEMERRAVAFLEGEGRDPSRPFAACVSFIRPHFPLVLKQEYWDMYWPEHGDLPQIPAGYFERMHRAWRFMRRYYKGDTLTEDEVRRLRAAYYGLVTYMDEKVGSVLAALERSGLAKNTVVIYTTDHGEHVGGHGLWWKSTFFEESARVPLIVSWPGVLPEGVRRPEVASQVDLTATILEIAGATPIEPLDGRSMMRLLKGGDPNWHNQAISEYYTSGSTAPRAMLRYGRYKLNEFLDDVPELYDLEVDPGEWNDLARDPAYSGVLADLRERLRSQWNGPATARDLTASMARRRLILEAETITKGPTPHPAT